MGRLIFILPKFNEKLVIEWMYYNVTIVMPTCLLPVQLLLTLLGSHSWPPSVHALCCWHVLLVSWEHLICYVEKLKVMQEKLQERINWATRNKQIITERMSSLTPTLHKNGIMNNTGSFQQFKEIVHLQHGVLNWISHLVAHIQKYYQSHTAELQSQSKNTGSFLSGVWDSAEQSCDHWRYLTIIGLCSIYNMFTYEIYNKYYECISFC